MLRQRFFSRGNTAIGALVLVTLVGIIGITLDSAKSRSISRAQTATVAQSNPLDTKTTALATQTSGDTTRRVVLQQKVCAIGMDYEIRENDKEKKPYLQERGSNQCMGAAGVAPGVPELKSSIPDPLNTPEFRNSLKDPEAMPGSVRMCTKEGWKCRVWYCKPDSLRPRKSDGKTFSDADGGCVLVRNSGGGPKEVRVGEVMTANGTEEKSARDTTLQSSVTDILKKDSAATEAQRQAALGYVPTMDSGFQSQFKSVFDKDLSQTRLEIDAQAAAIEKARAERDALQKKLNDLSTCSAVPENCEVPQGDLDAANKRLQAEEERLKKLQSEAQRLESLQKTLTPKTNTGTVQTPPIVPPGTNKDQPPPSSTFPTPDSGPGIQNGLGSGLGLLTSLLGVGGAQQPDHCILSYNPVIVQQRPATPECLNYNRNAQQCSLILQLMGRCQNAQNNPNNPYNYPNPACSIQASPPSVAAAGQPVTLTWNTTNAQQAYLSNQGQVGPSGSVTVNPQSSTTYTLQVMSQVPGYSGYSQLQGSCQVQVPVGGSATSGGPVAQISCQPKTADVGMSVSISYACQNATTISASGFSIGDGLAGSATVAVTQPVGSATSLTYGVTCGKESATDTAQCSVNVHKPSIVLVANPKIVSKNQSSTIGWVSGAMERCVLSSPTLSGFTQENAGKTSPSGVAKTPPLSQHTDFVLTCTSLSGNIKSATTTVEVIN